MNCNARQALSILSAAALGTATFATPSQARTIKASAGRAVEPADYACFRLSGSSMVNVCSTVKRLEVPLVIDWTGTFTVRINVTLQVPGTTIQCGVFAPNEENTGAAFSPLASFSRPTTSAASWANLFTTVTVPSFGALVAYCDVPQFGLVNTFTW